MTGFPTLIWLLIGLLVCLPRVVLAAGAQSPPVAPAYDVSSVKWNKSGSHSTHVSGTDERYLATNVSLKLLLQSAYDIKPDLIFSLPQWTEDARFDIEAKVLDPATVKHLTREQREGMVRQLLEDRFGLKAHVEQKTLPVFDLIIAKSGSKLTQSPPDLPSPNGRGTGVNSHNNDISAHDIEMSGFANVLSQQVERTVIDKTGLTGKYDLDLKFSRDDSSASAHTDIDDSPSIFAALEEQLGLKLQAGKGAVDTLVVDQITQPSEN